MAAVRRNSPADGRLGAPVPRRFRDHVQLPSGRPLNAVTATAAWVLSIGAGAGASQLAVPLLTPGLGSDAPIIAPVIGCYLAGCLFLLSQARHLTGRIRIGLSLSLIAIATGPVLALLGYQPPTRIGVYVLVVFVIVASVPLLVVGMHNLAWSLRHSTTPHPGKRNPPRI